MERYPGIWSALKPRRAPPAAAARTPSAIPAKATPDQLKREISSLRKQIDHAQTKCTTVDQLKTEIAGLQKQIDRAKSKRTEAARLNIQLKTEISVLRGQIDRAKTSRATAARLNTAVAARHKSPSNAGTEPAAADRLNRTACHVGFDAAPLALANEIAMAGKAR
jgi:septal ring factor EnvC (AmiA/AmiB activator)